jgi:hypothetical protein
LQVKALVIKGKTALFASRAHSPDRGASARVFKESRQLKRIRGFNTAPQRQYCLSSTIHGELLTEEGSGLRMAA